MDKKRAPKNQRGNSANLLQLTCSLGKIEYNEYMYLMREILWLLPFDWILKLRKD
jgi:hypothetical protein